MGTGEATVTVTYFGSWKCPHCARFSTGFLSAITNEYVIPGKITLKFRHLSSVQGTPFLGPDAPAAGRAGLAVWNEFPASYWAYHETIMANQPSQHEQWATPDRLVSFARQAGVPDPSVIRRAIHESSYEDELQDTSRTVVEKEIARTPTLLIDGTLVSAFKKERVRRLLDDATA